MLRTAATRQTRLELTSARDVDVIGNALQPLAEKLRARDSRYREKWSRVVSGVWNGWENGICGQFKIGAVKLMGDALDVPMWRRGRPKELLRHSEQASPRRFNLASLFDVLIRQRPDDESAANWAQL